MEVPGASPNRLTAFQPVLPGSGRDLQSAKVPVALPSDSLLEENARLRKALGLVVAEAMAKARDLQAARKECEDLQAKLQQANTAATVTAGEMQQASDKHALSPESSLPPKRKNVTTKPLEKSSSPATSRPQRNKPPSAKGKAMRASPGHVLSQNWDAAFSPSSPPRTLSRLPVDAQPPTLQPIGVQPSGQSQKLRVRIIDGQAMVVMHPGDPVAASILRSTMPSMEGQRELASVMEHASASMLTDKARQAGICVADDRVMLCPLPMYVTVARGGDPAMVTCPPPQTTPSASGEHRAASSRNEGEVDQAREDKNAQADVPAIATLQQSRRASSSSSSSSSSTEADCPENAHKSSPPLSAQTTTRQRNSSAFGVTAGKQAAQALLSAPPPARPASAAANKAPVPRIRRASAHSKSTASSPLDKVNTPAASVASAAVTLAQGGMLENPLMMARNSKLGGITAQASPPQASPDSRSTNSRRKARQKPQLPHRAQMLDTGAKSTNGVGEKLRKSLGSSYRSVPVVGLSFEAKVERVRRTAPDDLLSRVSSQDSEDEEESKAEEVRVDLNQRGIADGRGREPVASTGGVHQATRSNSPRMDTERQRSPSQQEWRRPLAKVDRPQRKPVALTAQEASGKLYRPSHSGLIAATQALDPMRHLHTSMRSRLLASQLGLHAAGSTGKSLSSKDDDGHVSSPSSVSPQRASVHSFSPPSVGFGMRHAGYTWSAPRANLAVLAHTQGEGSAVALIEDGDAALRAALAKVKGSLDKSVAAAVQQAASGLDVQDNDAD